MRDGPQKTDERLVPGTSDSLEEYLLVLRHQFAYDYAAGRLPRTGVVLDLGCGTGYGTAMLAKRGVQVVGMDVSAGDVKRAFAAYGGPGCFFAVYDGSRIPSPNASFVAITSFQVIEHVVQDVLFVEELARVLAPGGCLFLTTPNKNTRLNSRGRPWNRFHVREYSADELRKLLAPHFVDVRVLGVSAGGEVRKVEEARIRASRLRARLDPLNLRYLVPAAWASRAMRAYRRVVGGGSGRASGFDRFSLSDFFTVESEVSSSLDLLAVCTARPG